jgi:flagellar hook protein FlgE
MTAQRNFQANSRIISISDDLMGEVLNLKRG